MRIVKFPLILGVLLLAGQAFGATIYVSPDGDGTCTRASCSWAKAVTTPAAGKALATTSGDIVEFDGGVVGVGITYSDATGLSTGYAGITFRNSTESGRNGQATIDRTGDHTLSINHLSTVIGLRFTQSTATKTLSYDLTRHYSYQIDGSKSDVDTRFGAGTAKTITVYSNLFDNTAIAAIKTAGFIATRSAYNYGMVLFDDLTTGMNLYNIPGLMPHQLLGNTTGTAVAEMPAGWQHKMEALIDHMQTYGGIFAFVNYWPGEGTPAEFSFEQLAALMDFIVSRGGQLVPFGTAAQYLIDNADAYYDLAGSAALKADAYKMSIDSTAETGNYTLVAGSTLIDAGGAVASLHTGSTVVGCDAAGNTRLYGRGVDIGAFERKKRLEDDLTGDMLPVYYTVP